MNAEISQSLSILAESEELLARAAKYLRKLVKGHPEPLKGKPEGRWSREITKKHRMVYRIFDAEVVVLVISTYEHYEDK